LIAGFLIAFLLIPINTFAVTYISSCGRLNIPGETYILTDDIVGTDVCFYIDADDITIDCQWHKIKGIQYVSGIYFHFPFAVFVEYSRRNITIKNCIVPPNPEYGGLKWQDFIREEGGSWTGTLYNSRLENLILDVRFTRLNIYNSTLYNLTLTGGDFFNLQLSGSNNVIKKIVSYGTSYPIDLIGLHNSVLDDIVVYSGDYGILTHWGSPSNQNNTICNVVGFGNGVAFYDYTGFYNTTICNITAYLNSWDGIRIGGSNNVVYNIIAYNNNGTGLSVGGNNIVFNVNSFNNDNGIWLGSDVILYNATVTSNRGSGLALGAWSYSNKVYNVISEFNNIGVSIGRSFYNEFYNLTVKNNNYGVVFTDNSGLNILRNSIIENCSIGVYTSGSASGSNLIYNNILKDNSVYGVYVTASNEVFYNNLFINNNNFDITGGSNYWNTTLTQGTNIVGGPYIGGNYWGRPDGTGYSDTCSDSDKDGICDQPYDLLGDGSNVDYLPLAKYAPTTTTIPFNYTAPTGALVLIPMLLGNPLFFAIVFGLALASAIEKKANSGGKAFLLTFFGILVMFSVFSGIVPLWFVLVLIVIVIGGVVYFRRGS